MEFMATNARFSISSAIFLKNPESTSLGKSIIREGILLIDEIGFDSFTFKKLASRIGSNESSIYRYFENKHNFLVYLSAWYWSWIEYRVVFATVNLTDASQKLRKALTAAIGPIEDDAMSKHVDESALNNIIIAEFSKTLHTKDVDQEYDNGYYQIYIRVINRIADIVREVKPDYKFPRTLVSTFIKGALQQQYAMKHLPELTDCTAKITPLDVYLPMLDKILTTTSDESA